MIDKVYSNQNDLFPDGEECFEVCCDGCDDIYEDIIVFNGYSEVCSIIKADGWIVKKEGGDWYQYCPECAQHESNVSAVEDFS